MLYWIDDCVLIAWRLQSALDRTLDVQSAIFTVESHEQQRSTITRAHSHSVSIPCIARGWYKPEGRNLIFYNSWKTAKTNWAISITYTSCCVLILVIMYVRSMWRKYQPTTRIIELRWPNFEKVCFNAILCQTWLTAFWHENMTVYEMLSDNHFIPVKLSYLIPV